MAGDMTLWKTVYNADTPDGDAAVTLLSAPLYFRQYRFLRHSQWWSVEQHQAYQLQQVQKLATHAYDHVPYYRRLFDSLRLTPEAFKTLGDLQRLPLLTKEEVRSHSDDLKATNYPRRAFQPVSTSGSTGSPLTHYMERRRADVVHVAFFKTILDRANMNHLSRSLHLYGNDVPIQTYLFGRLLLITPFSLTDDNMTRILGMIRKVNPEYILAFPSALSLLTRYLQDHGIRPFRQLKVVFCSGEHMVDGQRRLFEEMYDCPILGYYDLTEQVAMAASCMENPAYHFFPEWGILELIDEHGEQVTQDGGRGEIVGTGFTNTVQPFFRYRTGDIGVLSTKECSCGRHYPLISSIEGRTQEFIVSRNGDSVPMTGMYATVPGYSTHVKEFQFSQRHAGDLVLHVVREPGYSPEEEQRILQALHRRIGPGFDISVDYIDVAERNTLGKILFLIKK